MQKAEPTVLVTVVDVLQFAETENILALVLCDVINGYVSVPQARTLIEEAVCVTQT